jgi:hypothetical protein
MSEGIEPEIVDLKRRVIHTEDRLTEIKTELRELNVSVRELNATITTTSKPNYQVCGIFGTLFCTVTAGMWFLAITPINDHLKGIDALDAVILPREVSIEKWGNIDKDVLRLENEIDQRATKDDLNRLIIDIDRRLPGTKRQ